ncbi:ComF family protein [Candidatus Liberibacter africanus]|nr:ComF family protein [Candidatus Liberibacter africanus]
MIDRRFCLCAHCWSKVYFISSTDNILDDKNNTNDKDDSLLNHICSVTVYCDMSRVLVRLLKYHDRTDLAIMMAKWMFRSGKDLVMDSDLIVAIPLHRFRLICRRYNQSAELARLIAEYAKKPFISGILVRHRFTKQQVDLSLSARKRNLHNAFNVPQYFYKYVDGSKVVLIDDVYTTGSTAKFADVALKKAGAEKVSILTFSKSLKN